jgi:hypothetical protein
MKKPCRSRLRGRVAPYSTARRTDLKRLPPDTVNRAPENRKKPDGATGRLQDLSFAAQEMGLRQRAPVRIRKGCFERRGPGCKVRPVPDPQSPVGSPGTIR